MRYNQIIDLSKSASAANGNLQFAVIHKDSTLPSSPTPVSGQVFWKSDTTRLKIHDGSGWREIWKDNQSLISDTNNNYDLGSNDYKWKDAYIAGNLTDGLVDVAVADIAKKLRGTFTTDDLVGSVLTITHDAGLPSPYTVSVTISDPSGKQELTHEITYYSNTVEVDFFTAPITTGTWGYYIVIDGGASGGGGGGGGFAANTNLSNLSAPTAINVDLLPDGAQDLGSPTAKWGDIYIGGKIYCDGEVDPTAVVFTQITTPANPASGYNKTYFKSDNKMYKLTSSGVESEVGGGSGSPGGQPGTSMGV